MSNTVWDRISILFKAKTGIELKEKSLTEAMELLEPFIEAGLALCEDEK